MSEPYNSLKTGIHIISPEGVYLFKEFTRDGVVQVELHSGSYKDGTHSSEIIYQHGSYWIGGDCYED